MGQASPWLSAHCWPVSCGRITVLPGVASAQGFQERAQTHSWDAAEKLFVARLHFHERFDFPLPFPKI